MSTPQTSPNPQPTKRGYVDDDEIRMIFNWIKTMPHGGFLGEVSYGSFQKKPIQVFAAEVNPDGSKKWQYQAQDGSFLCSMKVTSDQNSITFLDPKKGNWPLVTVYARFP
jgi:hypothetical protein